MNKIVRNIIIFTVLAVGGGFLGILVNQLTGATDPMQGLGALIWLVMPLAANLGLRAFAGDGWKDAGFNPHLVKSWQWYLAAPAIVLIAIAIPLALGTAVGVVDLSGFAAQGLGSFLPLAAAGFGGAAVKNIFEEFAWRGYLTPRFAALRMRPWLGYMFTGFIWAAWHIPYYLYFLDRSVLMEHTSLSLPVFIGTAFLLLPFHAAAYGELRLLSNSTWPAWLMHNFANAISLTLVSSSFITLVPGFWSAILSPGTEGVLHSLLMGLMGYGLYRYRVGKSGQPA